MWYLSYTEIKKVLDDLEKKHNDIVKESAKYHEKKVSHISRFAIRETRKKLYDFMKKKYPS